jgi:hypothetical protein
MKRLRFLLVALLTVLLAYTIDGCSEESSTPTSTPVSYPSVAKNWTGTLVDPGITGTTYLTANFAQNNESLSGYWIWEYTYNSQTWRTQFYFKGTIDVSRNIAFKDTGYVALNWTPSPGDITLDSCKATLNSNGDVIIGTVLDGTQTTFTLNKN